MECRIAGTSYHQVDDIIDQLHEGEEVFLVRDDKNEYDNHAVAVTLDNPYLNMLHEFDMTNILGYIPKQENKAVATILDMGWSVSLSWKTKTSFIPRMTATLSSLQTSKVQSLLRRKIWMLISETTKMTSSAKPRNPCQSNPAKDYLNYST